MQQHALWILGSSVKAIADKAITSFPVLLGLLMFNQEIKVSIHYYETVIPRARSNILKTEEEIWGLPRKPEFPIFKSCQLHQVLCHKYSRATICKVLHGEHCSNDANFEKPSTRGNNFENQHMLQNLTNLSPFCQSIESVESHLFHSSNTD